MAKIVPYTPTTTITKALFDFDVMGLDEFRLSGPIRVSLSDSFVAAEAEKLGFYPDLYSADGARVNWNAAALPTGTTLASNVEQTLEVMAQFANLDFRWLGEIESIGADKVINPADVGAAHLSDINISLVRRNIVGWVGISGVGSDDIFEYEGAAGDVYMNKAFLSDAGFGVGSPSRTILMHELMHSLGMSHPHSDIINGVLIITGEYAQTHRLGFDKLGFQIDSAQDMYREYFSIMSYDDENPFEEAHTPMILDVIALQQAYGEGPGTQTNGSGTSTTGNDTILAGTAGYRVYFDRGGNDTIDLSAFTAGAYLHMGTTITGAAHLVGVAMALNEYTLMSADGGDPLNLRWFYGEFERAIGSAAADRIVGNGRANQIFGMDGADKLYGENGNDILTGGTGSDLLSGGKGSDRLLGGIGNDTADYANAGSKVTVNLNLVAAQDTLGAGTDTLNGVESLIGSNFNDRLIGSVEANTLSGGKGLDTLRGGAGDDTLNGGAGADKLSGGRDQDTFVFDKSALGSIDQVLDFSSADDVLRLDNRLFTRLAEGALRAGNYHESSNGLAHDANDFINYNTRTGALSYDADGTGSAAPVQFATLFDGQGGHGALLLAASDFIVV